MDNEMSISPAVDVETDISKNTITISNCPTPYSDATKLKTDKKNNRVKRPLNAFMVWSSAERQKLRSPLHNAELSKQLGYRWKLMDEEQRRPYVKEAEELRLLHMKEFPDYKYKPKKRIKVNSIKNMDANGKEVSKTKHWYTFAKSQVLKDSKEVSDVSQETLPQKTMLQPSEHSLNSFSFSFYKEMPIDVCDYANCKLSSQQPPSCKNPIQPHSVDTPKHNKDSKNLVDPVDLKAMFDYLIEKDILTSGPICKFSLDCSDSIRAFDYFNEKLKNQNVKKIGEKIDELYNEYNDLVQKSKALTKECMKHMPDENVDFKEEDIPEILTL